MAITPEENPTVAPWVPDDSVFGTRLAMVRQRMGWNITQAAEACGLTGQSWGNWEDGSQPRNLSEVCDKIHDATKVDYFWLVGGSRSRCLSSVPDLPDEIDLRDDPWDDPTPASRPPLRVVR